MLQSYATICLSAIRAGVQHFGNQKIKNRISLNINTISFCAFGNC